MIQLLSTALAVLGLKGPGTCWCRDQSGLSIAQVRALSFQIPVMSHDSHNDLGIYRCDFQPVVSGESHDQVICCWLFIIQNHSCDFMPDHHFHLRSIAVLILFCVNDWCMVPFLSKAWWTLPWSLGCQLQAGVNMAGHARSWVCDFMVHLMLIQTFFSRFALL